MIYIRGSRCGKMGNLTKTEGQMCDGKYSARNRNGYSWRFMLSIFLNDCDTSLRGAWVHASR